VEIIPLFVDHKFGERRCEGHNRARVRITRFETAHRVIGVRSERLDGKGSRNVTLKTPKVEIRTSML
jgi:hypothetical protein